MADSPAARYRKTDIAQKLGSPSTAEREKLREMDPSLYRAPAWRLRQILRRPRMILKFFGVPMIPTIVIGGFSSALTLSSGDIPHNYFITMGIGIPAMYALFLTMFLAMHLSIAYPSDAFAMRLYRQEAPRSIGRVVFPHLNVREIGVLAGRTTKLLKHSDPEYAPIQRRVATSFAEIEKSYDKIVGQIGEENARQARADAAAAFVAIIERAEHEAGAIRRTLKRRSKASVAPLIDQFSQSMSNIVSGARIDEGQTPIISSDARTNRLIEAGRRAIELDPSMTDAVGAPVANLVNRHLPELLQRHAEAARHARLEDLAEIDRDLEDGIDLIRASIDEGLAKARSAAAADLRQELAFLRLRRATSAL